MGGSPRVCDVVARRSNLSHDPGAKEFARVGGISIEADHVGVTKFFRTIIILYDE